MHFFTDTLLRTGTGVLHVSVFRKNKIWETLFLKSCVQLEGLLSHGSLFLLPNLLTSHLPVLSPCCPVLQTLWPSLAWPYFLDWKTEAKLTTLHSEVPSCCCPVSDPVPSQPPKGVQELLCFHPRPSRGTWRRHHLERGWKHEAASWTGLSEWVCMRI